VNGAYDAILELIIRKEVVVSNHGYDEMIHDNIYLRDVIEGASTGIPIEEYPEYHKGPCALVLQRDRFGEPIHVLWGIPKDLPSPAVLVTAYRPDPDRWSADFSRRLA
jgi:hypothetical protein